MQREIAIVGVGMHPWGVFPDKSMAELGMDATNKALKDAKMSWSDIQAVDAGGYMWVSDCSGISGLLGGNSISQLLGDRGIPITNVINACATGQTVLRAAYMEVASGMSDTVLAVSADKSSGGFFRPQSQDGKFDLDYIRYVMTGETNPAYWAMECKRRMEEVGTTEEHLALVKVLTSRAGPYNPNARYKKAFTKEEVLGSPMVADPLRLFMICATSDGAAAVILTTLEKAKKITDKPVLIEGCSNGSSSFGDQSIRLTSLSTFPKPGVPALTESVNAIKALYKQTGRKPEDVDLIELPDNSPWHYLVYLENILRLEPGGADKMLERNETDPLRGKIPVCPSGGLGAFGEAVVAQGLAQVCELTWQLRGQAGDRQVKKDRLKVGLAQTYGYAGCNAATIISRI